MGRNEGYKYLKLLSKSYPNRVAVSTEIINLQAILNLPKGTEHFISDIHGEYESFSQVLRNASGVIKSYIEELFSTTMRQSEMKRLATLVYYPREKLSLIEDSEPNLNEWYKVTLYRLILLLRRATSKYTRSKVRKALNPRFAYILEELLHEEEHPQGKQDYYDQIIESIIQIGSAQDYIVEMCNVIRRLAVDRLHVIGDIFDRGPQADKIMDTLSSHHALDIQWGNHDIVWMGAAAGSPACLLNVIRVSARYANLHTLEDGYGINLLPLASYAMEYYGDCDLTNFIPETQETDVLSEKEIRLTAQIQLAAAILQFKSEAEIIRRRPEFHMENRLLMDKVDWAALKIPAVDPKDPYRISEEERALLHKLGDSFEGSFKLQEHAAVLFSKGSIYKIFNGNLLFHGCIPMDGDGAFSEVSVTGVSCKGRALLDEMERLVRAGYLNRADPEARLHSQDMMWYLWCGADSPLFGSDKMATFERYFFSDRQSHREQRVPYYELRDSETACKQVLADFGLDPESGHIINGHVPVKVKKGESPIKANGRLLVIDGGFARAYQKSTGIAGYTLLYNSHGLILVSHEPFESSRKAIEQEIDIRSSTFVVERMQERIKVRDTDTGVGLKQDIGDLLALLEAYKTGEIQEQR